MVNLMVFTGLRRGEVVGLQWGDIDLSRQTLQVVRNVIRDTKSEPGIYIGTPKTEDGARTRICRIHLCIFFDHKN